MAYTFTMEYIYEVSYNRDYAPPFARNSDAYYIFKDAPAYKYWITNMLTYLAPYCTRIQFGAMTPSVYNENSSNTSVTAQILYNSTVLSSKTTSIRSGSSSPTLLNAYNITDSTYCTNLKNINIKFNKRFYPGTGLQWQNCSGGVMLYFTLPDLSSRISTQDNNWMKAMYYFIDDGQSTPSTFHRSDNNPAANVGSKITHGYYPIYRTEPHVEVNGGGVVGIMPSAGDKITISQFGKMFDQKSVKITQLGT